MHHFGRGIVGTPSNFGQLGERPTHPDLLEYLAGFLREHNWSLKALHREIMLSATYQLSADNSEQASAADPDNRLLWRANWQRLDAELIRDSILAVAGTLDRAVGGPPLELDAENQRRTVYARIRRTKPDGLLTLFDFPNPRLTNEQRVVTNVPLQGLFFLNSEFVLAQAREFARRIEAESGGADRDGIVLAYRLLYGREPGESEIAAGLEFLGARPADPSLASAPADADNSRWESYTQVLLSSNELLYVN
jgi:hypothetical protein